MKPPLKDLIDNIESLGISEGEKAMLLGNLKSVEKEVTRMDFRLKRILKDKSIVINLLNKTIEDLQEQRTYVEASNKQLSKQKEEIEIKNTQLKKQNDIVERQAKKLEENLRELELSYQELEQFSYIASHDLKSPLRTIASYAQLLKRRYFGALGNDADEFIEFIVRGASHMDEIIRDLLEYSKSSREKDFVATNLNNTLEVVKFNLRDEITENDAIIESIELPELTVNKAGILQLFQNLVSNAIKFRNEKQPVIKIKGKKQDDYWFFQVSDNGVGMDEAYQEKAFLPFQRLNNLERPGTGMGLAICKKVVKMHKGDIWYQSQKGKGTTFCFTISNSLI